MAASRHILMGDPSFFAIRRGANPHTRNRWGMKKRVDLGKAKAQWQEMVGILQGYGVAVHVIPPHEEFPGLVFPANAGVVMDPEIPRPLNERRYLLANLSPARAMEQQIYRDFLQGLGLKTLCIQAQFEGEADLTPWGDRWIFTYGPIKRNRWVPRFGIPPWRRIYGFRSSEGALPEIKNKLNLSDVMSLQLSQEAFYHGDTVLCSFGPNRKFLMVYGAGLSPSSRKKIIGERDVFWLDEAEAWNFAANSFPMFYRGNPLLFIPGGMSMGLRKQIEAKGIPTVPIQVSEFFEKGGGSVKCLIGDLGA